MIALEMTPEEIETRTMKPAHLEEAVHAVRTEGYVVLKNVIEIAHLDVLRAKMLEDVRAFMERPDAPFNFNTSNIQQDPPPFPPYLFRDVLVNDFAVAVTRVVLGPGVKNSYYSGNTAVRSTLRQPVHADSGQLWQNMEIASPAYACVVNVPVVDMSPENGSTEIWPGSHLDTTISMYDDIKIPAAVLEKRRAIAAPFQPTVARGSILIRDIRMWHAGMPNQTDAPRPMIAMIHHARWMETGELLFPKGTEPLFTDRELKTCARFVDGPIDYIQTPKAYDYDPAKKS